MLFVKLNRVIWIVLFTISLGSCSSSNEEYVAVPQTLVNIDLALVPYQKLSEYHFFEGELKNLSPVYGVLPYRPASELFTDYALKKRFVFIPKGVKASYNGAENSLNFPIGTALIKTFFYANTLPNLTTRIIETRIMIRRANGWIFAEYVWNDDQTEAYLQTQGSQTAISWKDENNIIKQINYKIPSPVVDCKRCHGAINGSRFPIGLKPQNLNYSFPYSDGEKNQLTKFIEVGFLEDNVPSTIESVVDYNDVSKPLNLRVRSYFDANCSHCHTDQGEADVFDLRFAYTKTIDPQEMGVGVPAQHLVPGYNGRIVQPNNVGQSILYYRVNTQTDTYYMMPPLGRTITHKEGVQLIEQWINSF